MRGLAGLAGLLLVLVGCAPTVTGDPFGEVDLEGVLPGSGTFPTLTRGLPPAERPTVRLDTLSHPDSRVRDEAFGLLRRQYAQAQNPGPEFSFYYGAYYEASGDCQTAVRYYNRGLRGLYPYAFDRDGRDVWEYGYRRAVCYLKTEPAKAVRDAEVLARKAAPRRPGSFEPSQGTRALALLVEARYAVGDYEGALRVYEDFVKGVEADGYTASVAALLWRTGLTRGKALEALGRVDEARRVYAAIAGTQDFFVPRDVREEARKALERLGPPPRVDRVEEPRPSVSERAPAGPPGQPTPLPPSGEDPLVGQAREVARAFMEAVKALDFARVNGYLSQPFYSALQERRLVQAVTPEVRAKAQELRYEIARVTPPLPTNPVVRVEVLYALSGEERVLTLSLTSVQGGGLTILSGALPPALAAFLGNLDTEGVFRFLREFHAFVGLPLD